MDYLVSRSREPSSIGGAGLLATGVDSLFQGHFILGAVQILAGLAAIAISERRE